MVSEIARLRPTALIQVPDARLALRLAGAGCTGILRGAYARRYPDTKDTPVLAGVDLEAAVVRCGRIGTVGYRIGNREMEASRTTPEAPELQKMLREMVTDGCGACVMEVSSHALALRRADRLRFAAAIFTNLTRDHLDFHRDMEEYFGAKRRLGERLPDTGIAVTTSRSARRGVRRRGTTAGHLRDRRGCRRASGPDRLVRSRARL